MIECAFHGVLARDAERKTSKNEKAYLRLNVVENGEKALFVNVMAFDQDAIAVADKLVKGARRLQAERQHRGRHERRHPVLRPWQ
jgi:hypothetical protein